MWNRWQPIELINRRTPQERSLAECILLSGICFDFPCRHSSLNGDVYATSVFNRPYSVLLAHGYSHTTVSKVATLDEVTDSALVTQQPASLLAQFGLTPKSRRGLTASDPVAPI